jgi:hypothetical protein
MEGFVLSNVSFGESSLKGGSQTWVTALKEQAVLGYKIAHQLALEKGNLNG